MVRPILGAVLLCGPLLAGGCVPVGKTLDQWFDTADGSGVVGWPYPRVLILGPAEGVVTEEPLSMLLWVSDLNAAVGANAEWDGELYEGDFRFYVDQQGSWEGRLEPGELDGYRWEADYDVEYLDDYYFAPGWVAEVPVSGLTYGQHELTTVPIWPGGEVVTNNGFVVCQPGSQARGCETLEDSTQLTYHGP